MKASNLSRMLLVLSFFYLGGCATITRLQNKGYVDEKVIQYSFEFTTVKSLILVPVEIDGQTKNFIFDTGASFSMIQRDTLKGKSTQAKGASNRTIISGEEIVKSLKIGEINFKNTYAYNTDFVGLKEQVPNFGGLIGQPVIKKSNWLINYPEKIMVISNCPITDSTFQKINIIIENGLPYTFITINGGNYKALIDLGSTASLSIPQETPLAKLLLDKYNFTENEREVYTLGGLQTIKEHVATIPKLSIGNIEFIDVHTDIKISSKLRVGMRFFEKSILLIDNLDNDFKLKN
jgi:hypothetical protein